MIPEEALEKVMEVIDEEGLEGLEKIIKKEMKKRGISEDDLEELTEDDIADALEELAEAAEEAIL